MNELPKVSHYSTGFVLGSLSQEFEALPQSLQEDNYCICTDFCHISMNSIIYILCTSKIHPYYHVACSEL